MKKYMSLVALQVKFRDSRIEGIKNLNLRQCQKSDDSNSEYLKELFEQ